MVYVSEKQRNGKNPPSMIVIELKPTERMSVTRTLTTLTLNL